LFTQGDSAITRQAVTTARAMTIPKAGHAGLSAALVRLGRTVSEPADVRLDALTAAAPSTLATVDAALFDFLRAHLGGEKPMVVRAAAAGVLAKALLSPTQQLALADTMTTVGALEAPKLLPAFEKSPNESLGLKLVAAL
jgi:hypothetical protein